MRAALLALALLLVVGCSGPAATPTPAETGNVVARLLAWADGGGSPVTCGKWKEADEATQIGTSRAVLAAMREIEAPGAPTASAELVGVIRDGIVRGCVANGNCSDSDFWCDSESVAHPAVATYIERHDELQPSAATASPSAAPAAPG